MQSRTSCFNGAVFRKNMTRFAPVLALYTLLLLLIVLIGWNQAGDMNPQYTFMYQVRGIFELTAMGNLVYACLMAQLLFGDLYTTRMCNALHALPLRRETWFMTNVASGLTYSLLPTAVASLALAPLLLKTIFVDAWKIAVRYFLAANLEFLCFFGIAVFCAMLVGSRFTMVAGYGLINFGSGILYWLVNTVYTPMLYGIITPSSLAAKLMPLEYMRTLGLRFDSSQCFDDFGRLLPNVRATYALEGEWGSLWILALVGVVFAVAALVLYRRRNLECAGDAVCSRHLVPLFQILSALFVAVAADFFVTEFVGLGNNLNYLVFVFLFSGLVVGWFAGKMLVERSARVFRPRNWIGLGILAVVFAATMGLTKLDVLNLENRMPAPEDVARVEFSGYQMEDRADVETVLKFQTLALSDRVEDAGAYVLEENGEYVPIHDSSYRYWQEGDPLPRQRIADQVYLCYTLRDGRTVERSYNIWADSPAGEIAKSLLTRWDAVNMDTATINGKETEALPLVLDSFQEMSCSFSGKCPDELKTRAAAESLLRAIRADCAAGNMAQGNAYHNGVFSIPQTDGTIYEDQSLWLSLESKNYNWSVSVYPECENTIRWLRENGMIPENITILPHGSSPRYY
ncbi:MAG: hypothetical protein ACI3V1_04175 [Faecousia sp.]